MASTFSYRDAAWVAKELGLDESLVMRMMEDGDLPGFQLGPKWFVSEERLGEFLSRKESQSGVESISETHPSLSISRASEVRHNSRVMIEYVLLGTKRTASSWIDVLVDVLKEFFSRDPEFMTRFSREGGRKRRYIAREPSELYPGRPDLVGTFKKRVSSEWWVGTNYSQKEIETALRKACLAAGLKWGDDLRIEASDSRLSRAMDFVGIGRDSSHDVSRRHSEYFAETLANAGR